MGAPGWAATYAEPSFRLWERSLRGADFEVEEGGGVQVSFLRVGREQTLLVYSNKNGYKIGQKVTFYRGKLRGVRG